MFVSFILSIDFSILRYAFIEFASFEDAKEALSSCNKMEIEGRTIRLELQGSRGSANARSRKSPWHGIAGFGWQFFELMWGWLL